MKQIITILFTFAILSNIIGQNPDPLILQVHEESISGTDEIDCYFKVSNFDSILAYQFSISWDTLELKFLNVNDYGPSVLNLDDQNFISDGFQNGLIATLWLDPDLRCVSLDNETTLISFRFKRLDGPGKFVIGNDPIFVEAVRSDGIIPEIIFIDNYGGVTHINDGIISKLNQTESDKISIYPNPANDRIYLQWNDLSQIPDHAILYNLQGKVIGQNVIQDQSIVLPPDVIPGTYLLMLQKSGQTIAIKKVHIQ